MLGVLFSEIRPIYIVLVIIILVLIWILTREARLWYWKINEQIKQQKKEIETQEEQLKEIRFHTFMMKEIFTKQQKEILEEVKKQTKLLEQTLKYIDKKENA